MKITGKRSHSSRLWLHRQQKDPYVLQAREEGYRSRAVFKLMEIDDRFHLIKNAGFMVDLGSAPGSWSQLLAQRSGENAKIAAIDLLNFPAISGVENFLGDFEDEDNQAKMMKYLGQKADLVISDVAPPTSGHAPTDHLRQMNLARGAYFFAQNALGEGGAFVTKVFQGGEEAEFLRDLKKSFKSARFFKPKSSRSMSVEIYVVAIGFKECS
ncbi:MAG: RlmE family RNA methyltransferase [Holosporaceae bacterium]|jgi:23S rRNA (uridine2552-2'-O)-methyltransferase|nr:RlmE family RNA methyltransferase [Holosporaceae bacterium]